MKTRFTLKFCIFLVLATLMPMLDASAEILSTTFYHNDLLGSPIAATDENGNLKWREQYRPYGERTLNEGVASDNSRWYTGHPQDANTGLIYAGARYYDPVVGRFMAIDPQEFTENNPSSFNRYAYANNNPYLYVDPNGEYIEVGFELISIGVGTKSLINNLSNGNYWSAGADSIALVTDVTLLFIPGAPGIAGSIRQASNAIDAVAMRGADVTNKAVIGKVDDLNAPGALKPGENTLLKHLPNQGNPKANWKQNSSVLRQEMNKGKPIRDASVKPNGELRDNTGFLRAERNLLESKGWAYDSSTRMWSPPQ